MVTPLRTPVTTVAFVDDYCQHYQHLFKDVRNFEAFKFLHIGILSEIPRKSLPAIARAVGLKDSQPLHHFLRDSPWDVATFRLSEAVANKTLHWKPGNRHGKG